MSKQRTFIQRRTPIKRGKPIARTKPQYNVKEESKEDRIYYILRELFLRYFPNCACKLTGCSRIATDIHHKRGRGIWYLCVLFFLPVCRSCHDRIGRESAMAFANGFSIYRNREYYPIRIQPFEHYKILILIKNKDILNLRIL